MTIGGAEHVVVELVQCLRKLGYDVDVASFSIKHSVFMQQLIDCGCRVYTFGHSYYSLHYIYRLRKLIVQYDIVHTHNSSPQLFAVVANIGLGKKLVTTEHSSNNRKRHYWMTRLIDRWMYQHYDKIVCISDIAAEQLIQAYDRVVQERIMVIDNGVDVNAIFHAEPDSDLVQLKQERKAIVMVAGFREAKDQDTLVHAMELLDPQLYEIWLVGIGVREPLLKNLVARLNLGDSIRFLGLRSDIPNVLKAADIVVMSSHWEGLSLSNIEGMSVGKPFIASRVNGLKEVTEGYGVLFEHEDYHGLAAEIEHLGKDSQYYQQVADACYERAKQFDIGKMIAAYEKMYKRVVSIS